MFVLCKYVVQFVLFLNGINVACNYLFFMVLERRLNTISICHDQTFFLYRCIRVRHAAVPTLPSIGGEGRMPTSYVEEGSP